MRLILLILGSIFLGMLGKHWNLNLDLMPDDAVKYVVLYAVAFDVFKN